MFEGWLSLGGDEVLNSERTMAYLKRFLPTLDVRPCEPCQDLNNALGDSDYIDPKYDTAPWYRLTDPDTHNFYGMYPLSIQGIHDSTSMTSVTQFVGDGGFQSAVRHGTKEVRIRGLMVGANKDAVYAGVRWLRSTLNKVPCGRGVDCPGRDLQFFINCPGAPTSAVAKGRIAKYRRTMYQVEVLDGLRIIREYKFRTSGWAAEVDYVLSIGVPWAYSDLEPGVTSTGLVGTPVNEVACPPISNAYADLILDPNDGALPQPPQPPNIYSVTMPANWTRYSAVIPQSKVDRWGRVTPVVKVATKNNPARNIRVRFYLDTDSLPGLDVPECSWEGEFLVTYVPPQSTLTIDGIRRTSTLALGSVTRAASHLVLGTNGRPPTWPRMACDSSYLVVIDADTGLSSNETVTVQVAVGE